MKYKFHRGVLFVFVILLVSKNSCTDHTLANLDLFKTDNYFRQCEIIFFDFSFISIQSAQHYLSSISRPLLIQNGTNPKAKSPITRYQIVRCKIIIAVHNNNSETFNDFLNLHAFKESNYFIIFNLTSNFIKSGELAKFNSFIHVLIRSSSTKESYQGYDYIQKCNCLRLARVPFRNLIPLSQKIKIRWNFNNKIVVIGNMNNIEKLGPLCSEWFVRYVCNPHPNIIEIHANYFNFTPYYKRSLKVNKFFWDNSLYEKDVNTYISDNIFYEWNRNYSNGSLQYFFTGSETYTLAYCEDELKFPNLSFRYWVSPFTLNVWILIVVLIFLTSVITCNANFKYLQIALFIHVSVFLRQGVPDRISLLQLGVIYVSILISSLYECVITTDVTVPDPPIVAKDPKELLLNWGYHVNHGVDADHKEFDAIHLSRGFEKNKITALFKEKLIISLEIDNHALGKTGSKSSTAEKASLKEIFVNSYKFLYPKRFCHTTVEPFFDLNKSYLSKGRGTFKIISMMTQIREGGFFKYWTERHDYMLKCVTMIGLRKPELEVPIVSPIPLKGKIRHIFEIYAIGNCFAILCLTGKYAQVYGSKYFKRICFFC